MVTAITEGMEWLGLDWDEGPFFQSERIDEHRTAALRLLDEGKAYRCFCDPAALEAERNASREQNLDWRYGGHGRLISRDESLSRAESGESHAVRFAVPHEEAIGFYDHIHGEVRVEGEQIEDFVLLRSDGQPTYQIAVVVDDAWMKITHVIRGADHLSNVPKQILLFRALEMPVPEFAHLPLILGQDGKRLSKRHGATAVGEYREKGYLAEAVVNFLSLLGWSPKDDREFLRRDELIDLYTLEGVNKKPAAFDETKLEWLNGQYMNLLPSGELLAGARASFEEAGYKTAAFDDSYMSRVVDMLKERVRLFTEFGERGGFFFRPPEAYDPEAVGKRWKDPQEVIRKLKLVEERFTALPDWNEAGIEGVIRALAEEEEVGAGQFIHPVRVALTGIHTGPGLFELIELIGSEESVSRLISAIEFLSQREG